MNAKKKTPVLSIVLYVIAALVAILFAWTFGSSVSYIGDYLKQSGAAFGDVAKDVIMYVITQSINYLVYAILIFAAGRIIALVTPVKDAVAVVEAIEEIAEDEEIADIEVSEAFTSVEEAVEAVKEAEAAVDAVEAEVVDTVEAEAVEVEKIEA